MRVALATALAVALLAAVALGQDTAPIEVTATGKVTPSQAGTPRHPRGVKVQVGATMRSQHSDVVPMMPQSFDIWLPKGWRYEGAKHPACALTTLSHGGVQRCPQESIISPGRVGHAAVVGEGPEPPEVTIINGGATKLYLWVVIQNPARAAAAVPITISTLRSPRWSARLHGDIPAALQIVSGIPISLPSLTLKTRTAEWFTTTHCPRDHLWRAHLRLTYAAGQVADADGSVPCRS